jgi:hypothetical protein
MKVTFITASLLAVVSAASAANEQPPALQAPPPATAEGADQQPSEPRSGLVERAKQRWAGLSGAQKAGVAVGALAVVTGGAAVYTVDGKLKRRRQMVAADIVAAELEAAEQEAAELEAAEREAAKRKAAKREADRREIGNLFSAHRAMT